MVVFGCRHSISVVAVAVADSGRRRRPPVDLLSVAAGVPDLLQGLVVEEIVLVVVVAVASVVVHRWFRLRLHHVF